MRADCDAKYVISVNKRRWFLTYDQVLTGGDKALECLHVDDYVRILPNGLVILFTLEEGEIFLYTDLVESPQQGGDSAPVRGHVDPLVLVDLGERLVQPPHEVGEDGLHGDLGIRAVNGGPQKFYSSQRRPLY